jgi:hypothetical protein
MRKVNHFGIPTSSRSKQGEFYAEGLKVHLTDYAKSHEQN